MEGCLRSLRSLANHPFTEILRISKVPFISSLAPPAPSAGVGALKSFMKYDKKWGGGAKLAASKQVKQLQIALLCLLYLSTNKNPNAKLAVSKQVKQLTGSPTHLLLEVADGEPDK